MRIIAGQRGFVSLFGQNYWRLSSGLKFCLCPLQLTCASTQVKMRPLRRSMRQFQNLVGFWEVSTDADDEAGDFFDVEFRFDDLGFMHEYREA